MCPDNNSAFGALKGKNVLFITTKNIDYIRNTQEIEALKCVAAKVEVLGSASGSYIARLFFIYIKLLFMGLGSFDAVFVGFAPQLILPVFNWRFKGKLVAEDFFISVYDTMVNDRRKVTESSWAAHICKRIDEKTLSCADIIVADTRAHAKYFSNELGADEKKLCVVYLEADKSIYFPRWIPKQPSFVGKFIVLYFGSILPLQGTETILECVNLMKDCNDIVFDIIGPVSESNREKYKDCNVHFTQWLTQNDLADRIAAADICLAGHFNATIGKASRTIPGKAYIYEAMGKPMILGENPANHELFEEDAAHFFVQMGNAEKLKEKILSSAKCLGFNLKE